MRDRQHPSGEGRRHEDGPLLIHGMHAVKAVLANTQRRILALHLTENAERRLEALLGQRGLAARRVSPRDLDRRLGAETVHQGALVETEALPEPSLEELAARTRSAGPLVVLDQVTDPHNVGAILRSAAVLGAAGLVMTRRHSPPLAGALAKSASGGLEVIPVALVGNLAQALARLKELGVICLGLDGEAETLIENAPLDGAVALVLGAEGKGLRQLTRASLDRPVRIGASGPIASLNVSNAAAIALHVAAMQRK